MRVSNVCSLPWMLASMLLDFVFIGVQACYQQVLRIFAVFSLCLLLLVGLIVWSFPPTCRVQVGSGGSGVLGSCPGPGNVQG